jgi:hypothetical protein
MEPYKPRIGYNLSGTGTGIVFVDEAEAEAERERVEAESRRRRRETEDAQRRQDGTNLAELERLRDERMRREHIPIPGGEAA